MSNVRKSVISAAVSAGIICFVVYLRALTCGFVNLDDPDFVVTNTAIRQLDSHFWSWAFTTSPFDLWIPLTWLSYAIDYRMWGLNPVGFHLTNILLHGVNTALVVLIADGLLRQGKWRWDIQEQPGKYAIVLLVAGLLWGIHPLRVESVAWVSERKDVLNGVFSMASILCYLRYARQKEEAGYRRGVAWTYMLSFGLFMASLLAKPVSVVIPLLLLVADWYPLERLRRGNILAVLAEKIPFLVLSLLVSLITISSGVQNGLFLPVNDLPFSFRVIIAGNAVFEYVRLILWPTGIVPLYVLPNPLPYDYAVKTVAVALAMGLIFYVGRKSRFLTAGLLCFLIPLLPVLGFMQNGTQSHAARYTYLPSVVTAILAAVMIAALYKRSSAGLHRWPAALMTVLTITILATLGGMTVRQIGVWEDSGTMWSRVISFRPVGRAYLYRGMYHVDAENYPAAIDDYTKALDISNRLGMRETYNLYAFRGEVLAKSGNHAEAVVDFTAAIELYPHPRYFYNRGLSLKALGKAREAAADFTAAGMDAGPIAWYELR